MPFEQFEAEADRLIADILQHPQRDRILSEFCTMLRAVGIQIDPYDNYPGDYLENGSQAGANGSSTVGAAVEFTSGQSTSTHGTIHQEKASDDPDSMKL
jgi:hypothetical protein